MPHFFQLGRTSVHCQRYPTCFICNGRRKIERVCQNKLTPLEVDTDSNMFVALFGTFGESGDAADATQTMEVVDLVDPSLGCARPYLLARRRCRPVPKHTDNNNNNNNHTIPSITDVYEMTVAKSPSTLDGNYQSFAVSGRTIVQNGTLYVITPVDPLFWFLKDDHITAVVDNETNRPKWQPISQLLSHYDATIVQCMRSHDNNWEQLRHIFMEMVLDGDDEDSDKSNERFAKFSVERALVWLERKYQAVKPVLHRQLKEQGRRAAARSKTQQGAFLPGFTVASAPTQPEPDSDSKKHAIPTELQDDNQTIEAEQALCEQAKAASIQVVCNYLSPSWRLHFLQHLKLEASDILESSEERISKKRVKLSSSSSSSELPTPTSHMDWNAAIAGTGDTDATDNQMAAKTKSLTNPLTAGAKRLLKVNKKGLQKMSSFFGVSKKPPK